MLHVEIFYRAFCPSYVARPLSISSRCFLPAPLLCPLAVLLLSASFSLIQNHRALPSGGALRNFFAQGAFCSCCPLPPLPPTPKASFSAHALSASSLTYFSLSATAPRPLSSPRRQQRRRQWNKFVRLLRLLDPLPTGCKQQAGSQRRSPVS